jgi:hypothetical protein
MDTEDTGFATGLSMCLLKDGTQTVTANIPFAGFKLTGVGTGTAATDVANISQLQNATTNWVISGGTADIITASYSPAVTALVDGMELDFRATGANTTTTPTFSPNGLTAHTITQLGGIALVAGSISGALFEGLLRYNLANTRWELMNPATVSLAPFIDTNALVKGSVDATKLLRFEVDGFTAGTTRVLTPPNFDGTIATLAGVETLTNKTLDSPTLTGIPVAPTAGAGTSTTQIATTAFVLASSGSGTDVQTFNASNTWTKPAGKGANSIALIEGWGAGGGGGGNGSGYAGGGGGSYQSLTVPLSALGATETVTVGAIGAGAAANGSNGGASSFGTWVTAYGGSGGQGTNASAAGGSAGGKFSTPAVGTTTNDQNNTSTSAFSEGRGGTSSLAATGGINIGGGGGAFSTNTTGGSSIMGGGGGGGSTTGVAGTSKFGGNGGAGGAVTGSAGTAPGGGGGAGGTTGGNGALGRIKVTVINLS